MIRHRARRFHDLLRPRWQAAELGTADATSSSSVNCALNYSIKVRAKMGGTETIGECYRPYMVPLHGWGFHSRPVT